MTVERRGRRDRLAWGLGLGITCNVGVSLILNLSFALTTNGVTKATCAVFINEALLVISALCAASTTTVNVGLILVLDAVVTGTLCK